MNVRLNEEIKKIEAITSPASYSAIGKSQQKIAAQINTDEKLFRKSYEQLEKLIRDSSPDQSKIDRALSIFLYEAVSIKEKMIVELPQEVKSDLFTGILAIENICHEMSKHVAAEHEAPKEPLFVLPRSLLHLNALLNEEMKKIDAISKQRSFSDSSELQKKMATEMKAKRFQLAFSKLEQSMSEPSPDKEKISIAINVFLSEAEEIEKNAAKSPLLKGSKLHTSLLAIGNLCKEMDEHFTVDPNEMTKDFVEEDNKENEWLVSIAQSHTKTTTTTTIYLDKEHFDDNEILKRMHHDELVRVKERAPDPVVQEILVQRQRDEFELLKRYYGSEGIALYSGTRLLIQEVESFLDTQIREQKANYTPENDSIYGWLERAFQRMRYEANQTELILLMIYFDRYINNMNKNRKDPFEFSQNASAKNEPINLRCLVFGCLQLAHIFLEDVRYHPSDFASFAKTNLATFDKHKSQIDEALNYDIYVDEKEYKKYAEKFKKKEEIVTHRHDTPEDKQKYIITAVTRPFDSDGRKLIDKYELVKLIKGAVNELRSADVAASTEVMQKVSPVLSALANALFYYEKHDTVNMDEFMAKSFGGVPSIRSALARINLDAKVVNAANEMLGIEESMPLNIHSPHRRRDY